MEIHRCPRTRCEAGISKRRAGQCSPECARRRLRRRKITELPAFQNTGYWIEILQPIPKNVQRWFKGGSSGGAVIHRTLSQSRVEPSLNAGDGALPVLPASYICAHALKLPQISEIFESFLPHIFAPMPSNCPKYPKYLSPSGLSYLRACPEIGQNIFLKYLIG